MKGALVTPVIVTVVTDLTGRRGKMGICVHLRRSTPVGWVRRCWRDSAASIEGFSCNYNSSDAATRSAQADGSIPAFILLGGTSIR